MPPSCSSGGVGVLFLANLLRALSFYVRCDQPGFHACLVTAALSAATALVAGGPPGSLVPVLLVSAVLVGAAEASFLRVSRWSRRLFALASAGCFLVCTLPILFMDLYRDGELALLAPALMTMITALVQGAFIRHWGTTEPMLTPRTAPEVFE